MIHFFFGGKRKRLLAKLIKAFPKEYSDDVAYVCERLSMKSYAYNGITCSEEQIEWSLLSGKKIKIPYRIYLNDQLNYIEKGWTPRQAVIYHCIFSRSYDGYVREKHVKALLEAETPEWAMPYIIKICDEYVKEILETVYQKLSGRSCEKYRELCAVNFQYVTLAHCRMISYWNEFYRYECYRYRDYIGKKLYKECFGYHKTGQKTIQIR